MFEKGTEERRGPPPKAPSLHSSASGPLGAPPFFSVFLLNRKYIIKFTRLFTVLITNLLGASNRVLFKRQPKREMVSIVLYLKK